jgi:hypothetical protein
VNNDENRQEPRANQIVRHTFSAQERYILINLAEQILELLGENAVDHDPLNDIVGISTNELPPEDPVLRRLLPSAYREIQDAAEFRRYTEHSLREKKRAFAHEIREKLINEDGISQELDEYIEGEKDLISNAIKIELSGDEITAWLSGINDIRLALAVRLEIGGPAMGDLPTAAHRDARGNQSGDSKDEISTSSAEKRFALMTESDPMKPVYAVYSWLARLQEDFLDQLNTESTREGD